MSKSSSLGRTIMDVKFPRFIGPNADLAAYQWTQNYVSTQLLKGIDTLSRQILEKNRANDTIEIIDAIIKGNKEFSGNKTFHSEEDHLYHFLLDIPGVGVVAACEVSKKYKSFPTLLNASIEDLIATPKIGRGRARLIRDKLIQIFG